MTKTPAHVTALRNMGFTIIKSNPTDAEIKFVEFHANGTVSEIARYDPVVTPGGVLEREMATVPRYFAINTTADERANADIVHIDADTIVIQTATKRVAIVRTIRSWNAKTRRDIIKRCRT